jgi:hypothetical protein
VLTAESIQTEEQAWQVVFVYVRRWHIELSWKYEKSALAFQSPRVYEGEAREKLLPLTRLRCALSRLWQDWHPNFAAERWLPSTCSVRSTQKTHDRLFLFLRPCSLNEESRPPLSPASLLCLLAHLSLSAEISG